MPCGRSTISHYLSWWFQQTFLPRTLPRLGKRENIGPYQNPNCNSYGVVRTGSMSPLKTTRDADTEGYACDHGSNKPARKTTQSLRENFKMFELFVNPTCSLGLDNLVDGWMEILVGCFPLVSSGHQEVFSFFE